MGRKIFKCWDTTNNFFQSLLLLAIRLYWGFLFCIGGLFKLSNMDAFGAFFNQLGLSTGLAYIVAILELVCGALIFFGFLSRLAAVITSIIMFSAYIVAHPVQLRSFLSDPQFFFSSPNFSFLFASLIILFFGPGLFSIDAIIKRKLMNNSPSDGPHTEPPKVEPPKAEPPKQEPPKNEPPKQEPPKQEPPKNEPPKQEPPKDQNNQQGNNNPNNPPNNNNPNNPPK